MPDYYELLNKLNYWKDKYKEDVSKLQSEIKKHIKTIDDLYKRIEIMKEDYYYQLWLKE